MGLERLSQGRNRRHKREEEGEGEGEGENIKEGAIIGLKRELNLEKCPETYKTDPN